MFEVDMLKLLGVLLLAMLIILLLGAAAQTLADSPPPTPFLSPTYPPGRGPASPPKVEDANDTTAVEVVAFEADGPPPWSHADTVAVCRALCFAPLIVATAIGLWVAVGAKAPGEEE